MGPLTAWTSLPCFLALTAFLLLGNYGQICFGRSVEEDPFLSLELIHINDIHAHFEEVNENVGRCHKEQAEEKKCFGGLARMKTKVDEIRDNSNFESIFLNAGDYYQGTIWYSLFKYEPILKIAKMFNYTVMGVGNHDFDDSVEGLKPFVEDCGFPVVGSNLDISAFPELDNLIDKSAIIEVNGVRIGVIGYIISDRGVYGSYNIENITFADEIESVQKEASRLKNEANVSIIIAAGHAGYEIDMKMAEQIPELDLVVGGHSHTFLFTGENLPSIDEPKGDYPTYITQPSGKVVPVVQVFCYTKYLGHLTLHFDSEGELLKPVKGTGVSFAQPILLDYQVEEDVEVKEAMQEWLEELEPYKEQIGTSQVFLQRNGSHESNIGNLLTDVMRTFCWNDTTIAFHNNGGIRSDIIAGEVTGEDVFNVWPFNNTIDKITIVGKDLREMLENTVRELCPNQTCYADRFVQVSGLEVKYVIKADNVGHRIQSLKTICPDQEEGTKEGCEMREGEKWCDLEDDKTYNVALPSFLATQNYRKSFKFAGILKDRFVGPPDYVCLENYIKSVQNLTASLEGRITVEYVLPDDDDDDDGSGAARSVMNLSILGLFLATIFAL